MIVQPGPQVPEPHDLIIRQAGQRVEAVAQPGHQGLLNGRSGHAGHDIKKVALPLGCGARHEAECARAEPADVGQDRARQPDGDDGARGQADEDRTGVQRRPKDPEHHHRNDQDNANDQLPDGLDRGVAYALVWRRSSSSQPGVSPSVSEGLRSPDRIP